SRASAWDAARITPKRARRSLFSRVRRIHDLLPLLPRLAEHDPAVFVRAGERDRFLVIDRGAVGLVADPDVLDRVGVERAYALEQVSAGAEAEELRLLFPGVPVADRLVRQLLFAFLVHDLREDVNDGAAGHPVVAD